MFTASPRTSQLARDSSPTTKAITGPSAIPARARIPWPSSRRSRTRTTQDTARSGSFSWTRGAPATPRATISPPSARTFSSVTAWLAASSAKTR